jgi:D-mannonate dehydratase
LKLKKGELRSAAGGKLLYGLLYAIRMKIPVEGMTTKDVYCRHEAFKLYSFDDFKKYDKKMIELTQKARKQIQEETREWELQKSVTPVTDTTSRGKKDWSTHEARDLLIEDTKSGKAASMTPKELYETQDAYKEFSLDDFRKHVYKEKHNLIAGPYWQQKRNKTALKQHLKNVEKMREEFLHNNYEVTLDEITEGLKNL